MEIKTKKPRQLSLTHGVHYSIWQCPTLTWRNTTLPSASLHFTSEFGMESGRTTALSLSIKFFISLILLIKKTKEIKPDDVLLSHGETPHYHRRYGFSLLSSEWSQVEQPHYGRRENSI